MPHTYILCSFVLFFYLFLTLDSHRKYRREIKHLRDEHPLFEAWPDISMTGFEDFVAEALLLPAMIQKTDPVSFFVLGELLHQSLQTEDDGSASFFLHTAEALLYVLEEPIRTQIRLQNIFEMTFDGMALSGSAINCGIGCMPVSCVGRMLRRLNAKP